MFPSALRVADTMSSANCSSNARSRLPLSSKMLHELEEVTRAFEHAAVRARVRPGIAVVQPVVGNKVRRGLTPVDVGPNLVGPDRCNPCGGDCTPYALAEVCVVLQSIVPLGAPVLPPGVLVQGVAGVGAVDPKGYGPIGRACREDSDVLGSGRGLGNLGNRAPLQKPRFLHPFQIRYVATFHLLYAELECS